ncbi:MAG: hypothetical protein DRI86_04990 [Bacteroidetes bacterium]|nr:MAG: hypothetical protein DRI86_04990 [Bacteroidota bacterium]
MKNIYLTLVLAMSITFASAQSSSFNGVLKAPKQLDTETFYGSPISKKASINTTKGSAMGWFNHAAGIADLNAITLDDMDYSSFYIFKDTSVNILYSDGSLEPVWWLAAANVTDPTNEMFDYMNEGTDDEFNEYTTFTFDSIAFTCIYSRVSAASVVDTLIIQIQKNTATFQDIPYGSQTITALPWIYHDVNKWYATAAGSANANVVTTIKYPLDDSMGSRDTVVNGETMYFYTSFQLPTDITDSWNANELPKVTMTFASGSTYTEFVDTLFGAVNPILNGFRILTYKLDPLNAQMYYGENSCSFFFSRQFANVTSASTGQMPFYLYMSSGTNDDFPYEYFDFYFHYTTNNVSIDNATNNELTVSQNRPNPFNGTTTIEYNLDKASNVSVIVYNVAGAQVIAINQGTMSAGAHAISIDGSDLQAGVYYYTLTADNNSVTKKMIVY